MLPPKMKYKYDVTYIHILLYDTLWAWRRPYANSQLIGGQIKNDDISVYPPLDYFSVDIYLEKKTRGPVKVKSSLTAEKNLQI